MYLPQVLQIACGLARCDLLTPIRNNPKIWQPVFESGNVFRLSSDEILDQSIVEFSESQIKKKKLRVTLTSIFVMYWKLLTMEVTSLLQSDVTMYNHLYMV
jgi:hypothetical protein